MIQLVYSYALMNNGDHAFGYKNKLPWNYIKEDMQQFIEATQNTILVMGANTFMGLPKKLNTHNRLCVVISERPNDPIKNKNTGEEPDAVLKSINEAIEKYPYQILSVIGGPSLLQVAAPMAHKTIITQINVKTDVPYDTVENIKFDNAFIRLHKHNKIMVSGHPQVSSIEIKIGYLNL